jgi:Cell wall-associated hydrolases (invasion-associated proteins)
MAAVKDWVMEKGGFGMRFLLYRKKAVLPVIVFSLVCSCLSGAGVSQASSKKLHGYTLQRVDVLDSRMKKVAVMEKGITFRYEKQKGNYIQISYYGKKRYLKTGNLVLDSGMAQYVRSHLNQFDSKIKLHRAAKVRPRPGKKGCIYKAAKGSQFKVYGKYGNYYKVQVDGRFGYVLRKGTVEICFIDVVSFPRIAGSTKKEKIVNFAKKFIGNPYVWGGTSLTAGCDCSGFVQQVYRQFGYNLPRCSYQQAEVGRLVKFSELKPGDLVFYYRGGRIGHVTMYIGNGKCIQARGAKYGIVMTDYDYSKPAFARRIL